MEGRRIQLKQMSMDDHEIEGNPSRMPTICMKDFMRSGRVDWDSYTDLKKLKNLPNGSWL